MTVTMVNLHPQFHTDAGGWHDFVVPELDVDLRVPAKGTEAFLRMVGARVVTPVTSTSR